MSKPASSDSEGVDDYDTSTDEEMNSISIRYESSTELLSCLSENNEIPEVKTEQSPKCDTKTEEPTMSAKRKTELDQIALLKQRIARARTIGTKNPPKPETTSKETKEEEPKMKNCEPGAQVLVAPPTEEPKDSIIENRKISENVVCTAEVNTIDLANKEESALVPLEEQKTENTNIIENTENSEKIENKEIYCIETDEPQEKPVEASDEVVEVIIEPTPVNQVSDSLITNEDSAPDTKNIEEADILNIETESTSELQNNESTLPGSDKSASEVENSNSVKEKEDEHSEDSLQTKEESTEEILERKPKRNARPTKGKRETSFVEPMKEVMVRSRKKKKSPLLPSSPDSQLLRMLNHREKIEDFKEHLPPNEVVLVEMWREIQKFSTLCATLDSLVANNLISVIHKTYGSNEDIPVEIKTKLHSARENDSFDERVTIMESLQNDIFQLILSQSFSKVSDSHKKSLMAKRKITKSMKRDPFEDLDSSLVRFTSTKDGDVMIACTAEKLIHTITSRECRDVQYINSFVLTYGYYTKTPIDFLDLLAQRMLLVSVRVTKETENQGELKIVLLKVINIVKLWIDMHPDVIRASPEVVERIRFFIQDIPQDFSSTAANLQNQLERKLQAEKVLEQEDLQFTEEPPKMKKLLINRSVLPSQMRFEYISPVEFARQMALLDHKLYRSILPNELLHLNWTRNNKQTVAPNVLKMIQQFNRVGEWVIDIITKEEKEPQRVKTLSRIIEVAYESYKLANFNGAMAVLSGLKHFSVTRLKSSWNELPSTAWDKWDEISAVLVLDDNFKALKDKMQETLPPLIPYLGVYLSSLTFNDAEPNFTKEGLINLPKLQFIGDVVASVKQGQSAPFCLQKHELIQYFIQNLQKTNSEEPELRKLLKSKKKNRLSVLRPVKPIKRRTVSSDVRSSGLSNSPPKPQVRGNSLTAISRSDPGKRKRKRLSLFISSQGNLLSLGKNSEQ